MIFLEVPFREKDEAKALGARWDGSSKKWYIPTDLAEDLSAFQRWLPIENTLDTIPDKHHQEINFSGAGLVVSNPVQVEKKGAELSSVLRKVQSVLRQGFPGATWVIAEIANLNNSRGHIYLELTESNEQGKTIASCRAMIWKSQAQGLLQRFETETGSVLATGQKILLLTEFTFHEQYGFSMVVQDIDPSYTLGALEQNLSNIRKQLIAEGLYQKNKRLSLPKDFFRVAVIAPPAAAGLGDFRADADKLQTAGLCEFKYFYSAFQGESVESEMTAAMEAIQSLHQSNPFDALVIIRGGGAKLDLNMLNVYALAKGICEASLPVLTGIGHERDSTILDEVSHSKFDTPSKVVAFIRHEIFHGAQQAMADWQTIERASRQSVQLLNQSLIELNQRITSGSQSLVYQWKQKIEPLLFQVERLSETRISSANSQLDQLKQAIDSQLKSRVKIQKIALQQLDLTVRQESKRVIEINKQQIVQWIALVLSSGPKTQLNRGFSIAKDAVSNQPVTTAEAAIKLDSLALEFVDGSIKVTVDKQKISN
ncbi:MAG: exodeoxyribonuclease VII large subunit [Gammaproteobacteria bacterium]|nr:exodeoxyribonuclease VII large subunit [Gammaproteobacteria bacterium]